MPQAEIGQRVQIDLSGLQAPGIAIGGGVLAIGEIIAIDPTEHEITVQLEDLAFEGNKSIVTAPANQVSILPQAHTISA